MAVRSVWIPSLAVVVAAVAATASGAVTSAPEERSSGSRAAAPALRQAADPANPCVGASAVKLRCPDLMMRRPFGLRIERTKRGHVLLRAGNSIDNVGDGPASLRGTRTSRRWMTADQVLLRTNGTKVLSRTGGRLEYKLAHRGRHYWKFHDAARFELWALDAAGTKTRVVRTGPKVAYCLRDLVHTRPSLVGSPRRVVYPACSTNPDRTGVTLGTSVGWSDVYPPTYPEQWIDVTGLRGCFAYVHTADPGNAIHESDEDNNVSQVIVRLPFRKRAARGSCPGREFGVRQQRAGSRVAGW